MKFPLLTAKEVIKIIEKLGFAFIRQKGSHMFFRNVDGRTTLVPSHPGEKLDTGLLTKIIKKDLKMEKDDFFNKMKEILLL